FGAHADPQRHRLSRGRCALAGSAARDHRHPPRHPVVQGPALQSRLLIKRSTNPHDIMSPAPRSYRYYDLIMAAFVCVLLCSNLIGAAKAAQVTLPVLGQVTFGADLLFFPLSYIFGDILTEVYGYGRDRRVVWAGFSALAFAAFMAFVVVHLPP